jgi:hypothetical protein
LIILVSGVCSMPTGGHGSSTSCGVGQHVIGLEVGVAIVVEGVAMGDLCVDPADREVHLGEPPSGVIGLLAPD